MADAATAIWPAYPTTAAKIEHDDTHSNFGIAVHPDHRRQALGQAVYSHIIERLSHHHLANLFTSTNGNQTDAVGFQSRRGFETALRRPVPSLDAQSFEVARSRVGEPGRLGDAIKISTLHELMSAVLDWKCGYWNLDWEIDRDVPSVDAPARQTFEDYTRCFADPSFAPESWFIALHGNEWVGMRTIFSHPSTLGTFYAGVTGVPRRFRRRGIATAMKLCGIDYVKRLNG